MRSTHFGGIRGCSCTGQCPNVIHGFFGLLGREGWLTPAWWSRKVSGGTLRSQFEANPDQRWQVSHRKERYCLFALGQWFTRIKHASQLIGCLNGPSAIGKILKDLDGFLHSIFISGFPEAQYCLFQSYNHLLSRLFVQSILRQNCTHHFGTSPPEASA
ncbi:MAG: hypothetical protein P4L51_11060 [Puia sp.]|nr:hypothetical protein [Puia sp.]